MPNTNWEEIYDKKFTVLHQTGAEDAEGYFMMKEDKEDVKQFISHLLQSERSKLLQEIEENLPEVKKYKYKLEQIKEENKIACLIHYTVIDGYNECLSEVKSIINSLK